jgi:UDP:flavonoid glycosyltransferase YjiC (YdhE family)
MDIFEGDYNLVASAPELTGVEKLPKDWNYIGPIFAKLDGEIPEEIMNISRDKPLIYFSMGSSANKDILIKVLKSFNTMPYNVICPMKFHLNDEKIEVPDNVYLFDWLPAHKVNSMVDLAVLHGGEGTVQTACYSGKPFIGIGLQPEQEANIEYCVKYGNAARIKRKDISVEKLSNTIENVLADSRMIEKAIEIKKVLSNYDGAKNAADSIIKNFSV